MEKLTREQKRALMDQYFALTDVQDRNQAASDTFHFMLGYLVGYEGRASDTFFLRLQANLNHKP